LRSQYIQHSAHILPGRDGLFDLIEGQPTTLHNEPGLVLANQEFVMWILWAGRPRSNFAGVCEAREAFFKMDERPEE
jgi:hypothetical protein